MLFQTIFFLAILVTGFAAQVSAYYCPSNIGLTASAYDNAGLVQAGSGWSAVDADGYPVYVANGNTGASGKYFPDRYMPPDLNTNLRALAGTFTNLTGDIVGGLFGIGTLVSLTVPLGAAQLQSRYMPPDLDTNLRVLAGIFANLTGDTVGGPFGIGTLVSLTAPLGAAQFQLGLADDIFRDNIGDCGVKTCCPPVPLPSAVWLLGAGLLSILGLKKKLVTLT